MQFHSPGAAPLCPFRLMQREQLVPSVQLRVADVFNLEPRCTASIGLIPAVRPFRDDAFKVALAGDAEQVAAALSDVIEVQQSRLDARHDAPQTTLAMQQWQGAEVLAVNFKHIERIEVRPLAPEQQIAEVAAAVCVQATDFAIEHRRTGAHRMRDFLRELWPLFERVAVAGDELSAMAADLRQRAEAV